MLCLIFISSQIVLGQSSMNAKKDTTHKYEKLPLQFELPEDFRYGKDKAARQADKKAVPDEGDLKILAVVSHFNPDQKPGFSNRKSFFQSPKSKSKSRKTIRFSHGSFQEVSMVADWWQETDKLNFGLYGDCDRGNGQYKNSQFMYSNLQAQLGSNVTEQIAIHGSLKYSFQNYGLYGSSIEGLERKVHQVQFHTDARWLGENNQSLNLTTNITNSNFLDTDFENVNKEWTQQFFGVGSIYQQQLGNFQLKIKSSYQNSSLSLISKQNFSYFRLNSSVGIPLWDFAVFVPGLALENIKAGKSFSVFQISPEVEITGTISQNFGIKINVNRDYSTMDFSQRLNDNPFLSSQFDVTPVKNNFKADLTLEYQPFPNISFMSQIKNRKFEDFPFWTRQEETGLFQLNRVNKYNLFSMETQIKIRLLKNITVYASAMLFTHSVEDDSLQSNINFLPYHEKSSFLLKFDYQPTKRTKLVLNFKWTGNRKTAFFDGEKLNSYELLSLKIQHRVKNYFSVFLNGGNLLKKEYAIWQGFPALGLTTRMGIEGSW